MLRLDCAAEERALQLHAESPVVLIHEDVMSIDVAEHRSRGEDEIIRRRHLPYLRRGMVDLVCETVGGTSLHSTFPLRSLDLSGSDSLRRTLELIAHLRDDMNQCVDEVALAVSSEEIDEAMRAGKIAVLLGLEGGDMLQGSFGILQALYRLGVRCVQPAWLARNTLADGTWERGNAGLSCRGLELVEQMNRLGVLVDVSHAQEAAFWDMVRASRRPVIASHSNARALCGHPRNLKDDQIKALAQMGGVVGLTMNFSTEKETPGRWELAGSLDDLLDHVDHISRVAGPEHVGLGLDLNEVGRFPAEIYTHIWQGSSYDFDFAYPDELDSVASLPNFTRGLVARGYCDSDIRAILGGNFLRVLRDVL